MENNKEPPKELKLTTLTYYFELDKDLIKWVLKPSWYRKGKTIVVTDPKLMRKLRNEQ